MFTKEAIFFLTWMHPNAVQAWLTLPSLNGCLWAWMETATVQAGMVAFADGVKDVYIEKHRYGGNVSQWLIEVRQLLLSHWKQDGGVGWKSSENLVPECG